MQSPSAEPTNHFHAVDFAALSLEPAMQATAQSTHSIFAFESGTTWGSSNAAGATHDLSGGTWGASHGAVAAVGDGVSASVGGGMNNWGMIPTSSSSSSPSTNAFSNTDSSGQPGVSASFLLSSSNTWSGGVSGLSGNALGGSSVMNGEHHTGSSTGD